MTISLMHGRRKTIEAAPTDDGLEPLAEANLGILSGPNLLGNRGLKGEEVGTYSQGSEQRLDTGPS
jgi:hypothetical protein